MIMYIFIKSNKNAASDRNCIHIQRKIILFSLKRFNTIKKNVVVVFDHNLVPLKSNISS